MLGRANSDTTSAHSRPRNATMQLRSGKRKLDAYQPTFEPNLDIATVVFSHVQCVGTRLRLAQVSKLWRDASKLAAGYPRRFDFSDAEAKRLMMEDWRKYSFLISLLDNDEALSLPREQVFELLESIREKLGCLPWAPQNTEYLLHFAAMIGSVRMLKWAQENDMHWPPSSISCAVLATYHGHLPALQWLHENGCPMDVQACRYAADNHQWDCLRYLVDNKCPGWERFSVPKTYAHRLR